MFVREEVLRKVAVFMSNNVDGDEYNVYYKNERLEPKEIKRGAGKNISGFCPSHFMCTSELLNLAK